MNKANVNYNKIWKGIQWFRGGIYKNKPVFIITNQILDTKVMEQRKIRGKITYVFT